MGVPVFGTILVFGGGLCSAVGILGSVFLGLCVYNDARMRRNENAAMWGVLSGVFNIAALIYLILAMTSKNQPAAACVRHLPLSGTPASPFAGQPAPVLPLEEAEAYRKRRTRYLVLWIVMMVLGVLLGIVLGFTLVGEMLSTGYYWD